VPADGKVDTSNLSGVLGALSGMLGGNRNA
jgi:hypothetical protein